MVPGDVTRPCCSVMLLGHGTARTGKLAAPLQPAGGVTFLRLDIRRHGGAAIWLPCADRVPRERRAYRYRRRDQRCAQRPVVAPVTKPMRTACHERAAATPVRPQGWPPLPFGRWRSSGRYPRRFLRSLPTPQLQLRSAPTFQTASKTRRKLPPRNLMTSCVPKPSFSSASVRFGSSALDRIPSG